LAVLPRHQPDQPDGGQHGGDRVGLDGVAEVAKELAASTLDVAQRGVDEFAGRQFVFQCMHDVADLGTLLVDFALEDSGILLRFDFDLITCTHDVCPLTASISLFIVRMVRSVLKCDASIFFLPAETIIWPITVTTPPTIRTASQEDITVLRP